MISSEIRKGFLEFFKKKGHTIVSSSPVVPHEDPTLLFNNAGMNQFKDVFLGQTKREYTRAVSAQKCIRVGGKHNDLDNVGHTARHLTFFEMLGNFSFGDYFKKEAIAFAWEATLSVFQFDPKFLWVTVFEEDDEAFELWKAHIPVERIVRMGEKDNFWAMGDTGPCGPCSELYYDKGKEFGSASHLKEDVSGERYLEFWNLVFMQYNRNKQGTLTSLPNQSIDTGAGIERVVSLKMGVTQVFQTDLLRHLIAQIERISGYSYPDKEGKKGEEKIVPAFHVIADHLRSLCFAITDGAHPSNVDRGYVLRKLIRRAVRYGRTFLKMENPFLGKIVPSLIEVMGDAYPELKEAEGRLSEILTLEEESFIRTLKRGGNILSVVIDEAMKSPQKQIEGEQAFKLKDTYGFPLEEILLIAKDYHLEVNIDSYQILEEEAKERSRAARSVGGQEAQYNLFANFASSHSPCQFVGYGEMKIDTEILAIVEGKEFVDSIASKSTSLGSAEEGTEALLILKKTPFYAEKGGQVSDIGRITTSSAFFRVTDCQSPFKDVVVHKGILEKGVLRVGEKVNAVIDEKRRLSVSCHHTATHLLHYALQRVLGNHIKQAGSLVEPCKLRFDFNHHKPVTQEEIWAIEDIVNEKIRENQSVNTYELPFDEVQHRKEIKQFFGDKYGAHVRVVDICYSQELCGGTHAYHVGMLGYFRILKESSIAAGVRRIEAVCGKEAEKYVRLEEKLLEEIATDFKVQPLKIGERAKQIVEEIEGYKRQIRSLKREKLHELANTLRREKRSFSSCSLIANVVEIDGEDLMELADLIATSLSSTVIVLALKFSEKVQVLIKVTPDLIQNGKVGADALIKLISPVIQGGGGGRKEMAQAGGKNPSGLEAAFSLIERHLQ